MAEAPGTQLGAYRIIGPIGTGAFATVYRAVDERFESEVAVKVLAENHSLDLEIRERFLAEARLLRRLSHPNLITVFDIGETTGRQPFIALELAVCSLRDRRAVLPRVTAGDIEEVAETLGAALAALHRERIVHRDVSPQNLLVLGTADPGPRDGLLGHGERLALADLGFAKDLAVHSGFTAGGGTAGFSPPDQRRGATTADPADDVYSASAVLVWLATGRSPTDGTPAPTDYVLDGPTDRLAIELDRGMSRARAKRHPDIRHWTDAIIASVVRPEVAEPPAGRRSRDDRRFRALSTVLLVAAIIVGAGIGWIGRGSTDRASQLRQDIVDGRQRVQVIDDGTVAAIFGPPQIDVGDQVRFDAGVVGGVSYFWISPDAQLIAGEPSLTIPEVTETMHAVTLVVIRADGHPVSVTYELTPTDQ